MPINVAIVDDDSVYSEGIRLLLAHSPDRFACIAVCGSAEQALAQLPALNPDVVLMDIQLPGMSGPQCVAALRPHLKETEILMLTVFEEYDRIYEALVAGATGYLLKRSSANELMDAIEELHKGGSPMSSAIARKVVLAFRQMSAHSPPEPILSAREEEILRALARGRRYKEIADEFGLSFHTVRTHVQNIYKKLHVGSRRQAVARLNAR